MPQPIFEHPFSTDRVLCSYVERTRLSSLNVDAPQRIRAFGDLLVSSRTSADIPNASDPSLHSEAMEHGVLACAYEPDFGEAARAVQSALIYLLTPHAPNFSHCLGLTDGAIQLIQSAPQALRAVIEPHLLTRDSSNLWMCGAWLLEAPSHQERVPLAHQHTKGQWFLSGKRVRAVWPNAPLAITLARPEGNPANERGLALFIVLPTPEGSSAAEQASIIPVSSLSHPDLSFADLAFGDVPAQLFNGLTNGLRDLDPLFTTFYSWSSLQAAAYMRHAILLSQQQAQRLGLAQYTLSHQPYYVEAISQAEAQAEAAFHLAFRVHELLPPSPTSASHAALLRILAPIARLTIIRQAVHLTSHMMEPLAEGGYVEQSGLPQVAHAAQTLPLWPSSTYALAQNVLRLLHRGDHLQALKEELRRCAQSIRTPLLLDLLQTARTLLGRAEAWLLEATHVGETALQAGALRLCTTIGHAFELALLTTHAQWALDQKNDTLSVVAAHRFSQMTLNTLLPPAQLDMTALSH